MIFDNLSNAHLYHGLGARIARGLDALRTMDFSKMKDGKHCIDGDELFVTLSTYRTKLPDEVKPEAHREYIDIQYLISGSEYIGVAPLGQLGEPIEIHAERDLYFYRGETALLPLKGDIFHLYFPQDAHAPCIATDEPTQVRKAVVKVKI